MNDEKLKEMAVELQDKFYEGTLTQADILLALRDACEMGRAPSQVERAKDGVVEHELDSLASYGSPYRNPSDEDRAWKRGVRAAIGRLRDVLKSSEGCAGKEG